MANYDSIFTGPQIDEAINKIRSITNDGAAIDRAVDTVENIQSTPQAIDAAADYVAQLTGDVTPQEIIDSEEYTSAMTRTPAQVDLALDKVDAIPTAEQITETVDMIVNNAAETGEILAADGAGGVQFIPSPTQRTYYRHNIIFTKTADSNQKFTLELISNVATVNSLSVTTIIGAYARNASSAYNVAGVILGSSGALRVDGWWYQTGNTWHLIGYKGDSAPEDVTINISEWTMTVSSYPFGG